jgi:hypothetical protein
MVGGPYTHPIKNYRRTAKFFATLVLSKSLKSVKGPGNTFDLNPKWQRTLPSFGNFARDMYRVLPNPNINVDI